MPDLRGQKLGGFPTLNIYIHKWFAAEDSEKWSVIFPCLFIHGDTVASQLMK